MFTRLSSAFALALALSSPAVHSFDSRWLDAQPLIVADPGTLARHRASVTLTPQDYAIVVPTREHVVLSPGGALRVYSADAVSLSLRLQGLPPAQPLHWSSADGQVRHTVIANRNGEAWTPIVPGEWGLLLWPTEARGDLALELVEIHHGERELLSKAAGDSASCHRDAVCPEGNAWRAQIRSTVALTRSGLLTMSACSGTLLNATDDSNAALILTAEHCGISASNQRSVNVYFNYQRSTCSGRNDGSLDQVISGVEWLARATAADTALLRLSTLPPVEWNAYLSGWDARNIAPQSGAGIHHPAFDQKKISLFSSAAHRSDGVPFTGFTADTWEVTWTTGTTEPGSSGSGLWNPDQAVVGVLSGGSASCEKPSKPDYYGRLERAWELSPALARALDPVSGGSQRQSCGRELRGAACNSTPSPTPTPSPSPTSGPFPTPTPTPAPSATPAPTLPPTSGSGSGGGASSPLLLLALATLARFRRRRS